MVNKNELLVETCSTVTFNNNSKIAKIKEPRWLLVKSKLSL